MFANLISFLGLIVGGVLSFISPEEMEKGKKYFKWIKFIILFVLGVVLILEGFVWWMFILGLVFGFLFLGDYLWFGLVGGILSLSLVFVYGLVEGSLLWYAKKKKWFLINFLLFVAGFIVAYFIDFSLVSLAGGGCLGVLIREFVKK